MKMYKTKMIMAIVICTIMAVCAVASMPACVVVEHADRPTIRTANASV